MHVVADKRQKPVYIVKFKALHKVRISKLAAGLREIDLTLDVIDQEGDV